MFHGTRSLKAITAEDRLRAEGPVHSVSFTRNFNTALYWARLPRIGDDGDGAIIVVARELLGNGTAPFIDLAWDGEDEHEELHWGDVWPLSASLVSIVPVPARFNLGRLSSPQRASLVNFQVSRDRKPVLALQDSRQRHLNVTLREKQVRDLIVELARSLSKE